MNWPKKPISPHGTGVFLEVRHREAPKALDFQINFFPRRAVEQRERFPREPIPILGGFRPRQDEG